MDPYAARILSSARIADRQAEAATNRLAAESRQSAAESQCLAEAAGRRPGLAIPQIDCSWIERFWAFLRRAVQVRPA